MNVTAYINRSCSKVKFGRYLKGYVAGTKLNLVFLPLLDLGGLTWCLGVIPSKFKLVYLFIDTRPTTYLY